MLGLHSAMQPVPPWEPRSQTWKVWDYRSWLMTCCADHCLEPLPMSQQRDVNCKQTTLEPPVCLPSFPTLQSQNSGDLRMPLLLEPYHQRPTGVSWERPVASFNHSLILPGSRWAPTHTFQAGGASPSTARSSSYSTGLLSLLSLSVSLLDIWLEALQIKSCERAYRC